MIRKTNNSYVEKISYEDNKITIFISTIMKNSFSIELTNIKGNAKQKKLYIMDAPFMEMINFDKHNKTLSIIPINLRKKTLKIYNDLINDMIKKLYIYYGL